MAMLIIGGDNQRNNPENLHFHVDGYKVRWTRTETIEEAVALATPGLLEGGGVAIHGCFYEPCTLANTYTTKAKVQR